MRKRYLGVALLATLFLTSCNGQTLSDFSNTTISDNEIEEDDDKRLNIYNLAKNSGFEGTYEEWLNSIKGDVIELKYENGIISWKYKTSKEWTSLLNLEEIVHNSLDFDISVNQESISWKRKDSETWFEIIKLSDLKGENGKSAYDIAKDLGYNGDISSWLQSLKGENGKEVELSLNETHIVWHYKGDSTWNNLVSIESITGENGKSNYDLAKENGFEGDLNSWLESLKSKGIDKVEEKIDSDGYTKIIFYFTDDTTFEFKLPYVANYSNIDEKSRGIVINEIIGYGYAVTGCYNIGKTVVIPSEYKNAPIKQIFSFSNTELETLIIGDNVEVIGDRAFKYSTSLKNVSLPNSIKEIGIDAFESCNNLENIYYDGSIEEWNEINFKNPLSNPMFYATNVYTLDENGTIEYNGKKYTSISNELVIPNTITKINSSAFAGYKGTKLTIPNSVLNIDSYAFYNCKNLQTIFMNNSVTNINSYAFYNCDSLKTIYFDGKLDDWINITFENTYSNPLFYTSKIYMLDENSDLEHKIFTLYDYIDTLIINSNTTLDSIEKYKNSLGYYVTNLIIENDVTSIDKNIFSYFNNIKTVYYNGTIDEWCNIKFNTVYSNPLYYADNIYFIDKNGDITFKNEKYSRVTSVTLTENISQIGNYQFYNFRDLKTITIPDTVVSFGYSDFDKCVNLNNVYYKGEINLWNELSFYDKKSNPMTYGEYFYVYNEGYYTLLSDIEIPDDLPNIKNSLYSFECIKNASITDYKYLTDEYYEIFSSMNNIYFNNPLSLLLNNKIGTSLPIYYLNSGGSFSYNDKKYSNYEEYFIHSSYAAFKWNPLEKTGADYKVSGELNIYLNYQAASGVTYRGSHAWTNPIDGKSYAQNSLLPAWKGFAEKLNVTINDAASYSSKTNDVNYESLRFNDYKSATNAEKYVDLFYNTVSTIKKMGEEGDAVDLVPYIESGKMPAFAKFLEDNPAIRKEITRNGHIYYTPYFDGFQEIERMLIMDTYQVSVLLDEPIDADLGELVVGTNEAKAAGLLGPSKYTPFINATNNYDSDKTVKINKNGEAVDLTIKQTKNIIVQQNELLATGTATGKQLIDQFKAYLDKAFAGQIGAGKTFEKYADIFTSESAAYNTDELVALLRVFKANPDVLYSRVTDTGAWDEVFPVISRGLKSNRISTFLNFGATLFGIQGVGSDKDKLFIGSDGKLHDGATFKDNYDMLDEMSKLYDEGLIVTDFYKAEKDDERAFVNRYFAKTIENKSSFGLVMYDYTATQSAPNDKKDGLGTDPATRSTSPSGISFKNYSVQGISPILSPLTWVRTSADIVDPEQELSDKTGKEIVRYYEENRTIKDTSWCIPKNSTNKDAAVALMDYLWTKEGWTIQNFCTEDYYTTTKIFDVDTPTLKTAVLYDYSTVVGGDIWSYFRGNLGTAQGIGAYRPTSLDYQATNHYAKKGYNALTIANHIGVQLSSKTRDVSKFSWNTTVPVSIYPTIATYTSDTYKGLTKFWAQDKRSANADGWVNVVVNGGTAAFETVGVTNDGTNDYTMAQLRNLFDQKNKTYLYMMAEAIDDDIIPDEAYN